MGSGNVDLVRQMFEAFAQGGFAAVGGFIDAEFEMRLMPGHPQGTTFRGPDAAKAMTDFMRSFEGFRAEAESFIDAGGERVVVAVRERARPRGGSVELDQRFGALYTLHDGKITRMEWFDSFEQALAAAGVE